ncbi:discoidin domain-containing receptor A [Trichonephila inaurata madagascariensis]|uniref:Discoidin domain-containing receptor A n=1 Tax=Trichonephila inaurata madagascariensis TaxID=2747483 RepID=A0A8X7CRQ5_9ARAC|nr:discoidin domain-containing receptor A [Trichonephila inaurata madagascariensis]
MPLYRLPITLNAKIIRFALDRELNGGAWCPERQISKDVLEYLEVYLPTLHVITAVATQGRFGNGQGREYTEDYMLEYWRPGLSQWKRFSDRRGVQVSPIPFLEL